MRIYRIVSGTASSGTFSSSAAWGARASIIPVSSRAARAKSRICPATTSPAAFLSPAPTALPTSTVTPMVRPLMSPVSTCMAWLPVATAETLAVGE